MRDLEPAKRALLEQLPRWMENQPPDTTASAPTERKAYAPDPVGKSPEPRDTTPPDPAERLRVISWYNVNQLGEILDILI